MKTIKIAALAIFATATMGAQDLKTAEVPTDLMSKFQKAYPNATDVEWEMKGMDYNVEFDINKMEHEIWYKKDGTIIKTERDIKASDLPSAIVSTINSKYADYKIDSIEMTEISGKTTYEVELEKGWTTEIKVTFDANGTVLSSRED